MEVLICKDEEQVGQVAAQRVVDRLRGTAEPVIGLATGSSPLALYANLQRLQEEGAVDFTNGRGFALDEYVGISLDHPESYHQVIHRTVTDPLGMRRDRVRIPDGLTQDLDQAAAAYDQAIKEVGGVDVQVLGIGSNGHIGFNEPFTSFGSRTHVVPLTTQTREDNARFFASIDEVPTHAVTQGLGTILESKSAVLVAVGEGKAEAVRELLEGFVGVRCPATILQFHPDVTIVIDEAAASKLKLKDHFRTV